MFKRSWLSESDCMLMDDHCRENGIDPIRNKLSRMEIEKILYERKKRLRLLSLNELKKPGPAPA